MKNYKKKIVDKTLSSNDVELLITKLDTIIKEKTKGHANYSEDDIKQLRIIKFLLKIYEEDKGVTGFSTQEKKLSYHRVKNLLNELELNQIITEPFSAMGGFFSFEILDRVRYRDYLYKIIELVLEKFPKEHFVESLKKFDFNNQYVVGLVVTIIGGLIVGMILFFLLQPYQNQTEPPQIRIDSVSFSPNAFTCNAAPQFKVSYKVAHIGGKEVGFGQPYYIFLNQTSNTCLQNFTFFNSTGIAQPLCYNIFYRGNQIREACTPKFEPIFKETIRIDSDLSILVTRMLKEFKEKRVADCMVSEQVKVCVNLEDVEYCSDNQTVEISYIDCEA